MTLTMCEKRDHEHQRMAELLDRISRDVYSTNTSTPGLAVRMDRLERQFATAFRVLNWIGTGGLAGVAATIWLLYEVLEALKVSQG